VFLITRGPTLLSPEGDEEGVQVGAVDRLGGGGEGEVLQDEHHYRVAGLSLVVRPQSKAVEKVSQKLEISLFEDWLQGPGPTGPGRFVTESSLPVRRFGGEERTNLRLIPSHGCLPDSISSCVTFFTLCRSGLVGSDVSQQFSDESGQVRSGPRWGTFLSNLLLVFT